MSTSAKKRNRAKRATGATAGASSLNRVCSASLPARLRKCCNGHPHAKIPWPHNILHEAADEIERLRGEIEMTLADGEVCTLIRLKRALMPNAEIADKGSGKEAMNET